jgi:hypothetical protein
LHGRELVLVSSGRIPRASETRKLALVGLFALIALIVTLYAFRSDLLTPENIFLLPHLYLIPIILVTLWYPKRGLQITGVIIATVVILSLLLYSQGAIINPVLMFLYSGLDLMLVIAIALYAKDRHLVDAMLREFFDRDKGAYSSRRGRGERSDIRNSGDFSELVTALTNPDAEEREEAARSLGDLRDRRGVEPLIAALLDENRYVRREAAKALGAIGDESAIPVLVSALADDDRAARDGAAEGLASFGERAVNPLISALDDTDWHVRVGAVVALRIIGDRRAIPALTLSAREESRFVRREAVKALGRIGDGEVLGALTRALDDEDGSVRLRAVGALARSGSDSVIEPLTLALNDEDGSVRLRAAQVLEEIGTPEALAALKSRDYGNSGKPI